MRGNLKPQDIFEYRHHGKFDESTKIKLQKIGLDSVDELIDQTIPKTIRLKRPITLPEPLTELAYLMETKALASKNKIFKSLIGQGYYGTKTPSVIQRNILENPAWYTAYTPYQAEIAQGRLEALINYQTMVIDLTGMEIANASLLDEGTAAAEAMTMLAGLRKGQKKDANRFFVDRHVFEQTIDILKTRSMPLGIEVVVGDYASLDLNDPTLYGILVQYPNKLGEVHDYTDFFAKAKSQEISIAVAADLLSLALLTSPGELGAEVVVGSTQRFGVPLGYGGPHAAYIATLDKNKRQLPGRIIGASVDADGNPGYRMALQTREQHIRREKATSNICTAQVLLAVMAGMYAVYHGADGIRRIATKVHLIARTLKKNLATLGYFPAGEHFFDTVKVDIVDKGVIEKIRNTAETHGYNFNYFHENAILIALDETCEVNDLFAILSIFAHAAGKNVHTAEVEAYMQEVAVELPEGLNRKSSFLTHPVFNKFHTEHELLRYIKRLENKDLSLVHSMISLGSCTMKLNATTEMIPVTWPEFGSIHPLAPLDQVEGYYALFSELETYLTEITGFAATSLQPNSGAQGEYAGLMVIKAYLDHIGEGHRNITLIPSSAHGTNPASAVMAGTRVIIVACDAHGNIDMEDLKAKAVEHRENLAALMVTYPSTHGVFEEGIMEICQIIHDNGGQVYMDGANMNAQVGLTSPGAIGADVCHLNLHKTFCIPHGGGGPGVGPICVAAHLADFLPGNPLADNGRKHSISAISSALYGSAGVLPISYGYIKLMGAEGLTNATKHAILNANYIKASLEGFYPILYSGTHGKCAHEMILDCREFKKVGIEVEDIAKRLMDYGFHAPTVSFPVAGTLMVEPTESESLEELDRFCEAMIAIRKEIEELERGETDTANNVLKNAPHTLQKATAEIWQYPYSRQKAVYPLPFVAENKFWPAIGRIDSAYGDRNLVCTCLAIEAYEEALT
ncbi:MAG: aminomethyl-transferring glycine dehydrogenase [Cyclobacteriaceae bacterium]|nr:aminomethyl-transferring glycine dehydrogenase [Cyclobacteriaceae bacterium]